MGKRKGDQPNSQAQDAQAQDVAGAEPEKNGPPSGPVETLSQIAAPDFVAAAPGLAAAPADAATSSAAPAASSPVVAIDAPKADAASAPPVASSEPIKPEPIKAEPIKPELIKPEPISLRAQATAAAAASWARLQHHRATPIAASIAIAAVVGAMAGSVATAGLGGTWASAPAPAQTADARPLRDTIARINIELAALKASIENSGRTANAQFSKLGNRLDRVERAQAEPAAKLAKLTEAVSKLDHRAPAAANAGNDVTGSIARPTPLPATTVPARSGPPIIDGWVVRSVYNGAALIQARYGGVIEVEPGDSLPQLGRIENIRRQDGRWVVVTSRGMIVARGSPFRR